MGLSAVHILFVVVVYAEVKCCHRWLENKVEDKIKSIKNCYWIDRTYVCIYNNLYNWEEEIKCIQH